MNKLTLIITAAFSAAIFLVIYPQTAHAQDVPGTCQVDMSGLSCTCSCPGGYVPTAGCSVGAPACIGQSCTCSPGNFPTGSCPYTCCTDTACSIEMGYFGSCGTGAKCCSTCQSGGPAEGPKIFCGSGGQATTNTSSGSIFTAIGCIPVDDPQAFTEFLLGWGSGIAGGIAVILLIYGGFMVITSSGNPQKIQSGKDLITSAIMGLLLLLFGAFILRLVGVQIFNLPGF